MPGLNPIVGNYALARKLCRQAEEASKDSPRCARHCAKALGDAGEVTRG